MDVQFPPQLFPSFYNSGPPNSVLKHCAGDWGSYRRTRLQEGSGSGSRWTFVPKHEVRGETWRQTEPVPVPLFSPKEAFLPYETPPDPLSFTQHMQNFFVDHSHDAFGCMSTILGDNFYFSQKRKSPKYKDSVNMWRVRKYLNLLNVKICQQAYHSAAMSCYGGLLSDVVPAVPADVLGPLLYEELAEQRDRLLFCETSTGGALAFVPFSQDVSSSSEQHGCLLYPGHRGQDLLNFHKVVLQHPEGGGPPCIDSSSNKPFSFQLKGPIRQLSSAYVLNSCLVGVRLDHLCGIWRFSEEEEPHLLEAVNTSELGTCISVSPHISGEVLVASESGAATLWTVGKGMQEFRSEDSNLYFNAKSCWRWCEFSAHPRVMLYADRTGAELMDIRAKPSSCHTLFHISSTVECRHGERLILCRYLRDAHSFHHLVTTQYSAYIVDERFPGVPMLKLDHQMASPPVFCQVVPKDRGFTKVLLGSQRSQEITLLQYSGGRSEACSSRGPPQALLRATDSLKHLPVLIPHRHQTATRRLSAPATGLTCIKTAGRGSHGGCLCVLQLTEAGDIFYQTLEPDESEPEASAPPPQPVVEDTSSENDGDDVIGPTQLTQDFVAETPRREDSDSFSEDSEAEQRRRSLKRLTVPVVVNEDSDQPPESDSAAEDGGTSRTMGSGEEEAPSSSRPQDQTPLTLSSATRVTWKRWLQKLMRRSRGNKPRPSTFPHFTISNKKLLRPEAAGESGSGSLKDLREHLRSCMSKRSLVLSDPVQQPVLVPFPDQVDAEAYNDPLSRRLTASWRGEESWQEWWEEELGTNREAKAQALRRKRRREKEARRAAGLQMELSGSFSSSASGMSELDEFSTTSSQVAWFDSEPAWGSSQDSAVLEQQATETDAPPVNWTELQTPSKTRTRTPDPSPGPLRNLNLSATQENPVQMASVRTEDPVQTKDPVRVEDPLQTASRPPPPSTAVAAAPRSGFSSQFSSSQNSLGRLSQSSQPKKKKSRMGF
ncbi:unnamed protein product [Ophioblennius macclurei]